MVTDELQRDLVLIAKVANSSIKGLPIASSPKHPTLAALSCYTDAAGASFTMVNGKRVCHGNSGRGVSCLIAESEDHIWAWTRVGQITSCRKQKMRKECSSAASPLRWKV